MFSRLLALFITVPLMELYFFATIGKIIGFPITLLIIIITAIIGASLTKREGISVLSRMRAATNQGRLPHAEVTEGALILIAGALLLTPGFVTDVFGFSLLFPPTRALYSRKVGEYLKGKIKIIPGESASLNRDSPRPRNVNTTDMPKQSKEGEVVDVEVL